MILSLLSQSAGSVMRTKVGQQYDRTLEALEAELKPALDTITAKDARGWIRHAGYVLH
jgi:hypothetical protein